MGKSKSINELVKLFDNQDMGEYIDKMPEAHFDVDIKRRTHFFVVDNKIVNKLTEIAKL